MKFRKYLDESLKTIQEYFNFMPVEKMKRVYKIGEKVEILRGCDGEDSFVGDIGIVREYSEGSSFTLNGDDDYYEEDEDGDIPIESNMVLVNYIDDNRYATWYFPASLKFIKPLKQKGRFDREMVVEVSEPGQNSSEEFNTFAVNVKDESEAKKLQIWAFKNDFNWAGSETRVMTDFLSYNGVGETGISLNMKNKEMAHSSISWYKEQEKYRKTVYSLSDFFDMMEYDERIEIKPSKIKEK
jgi:hypothetical protein